MVMFNYRSVNGWRHSKEMKSLETSQHIACEMFACTTDNFLFVFFLSIMKFKMVKSLKVGSMENGNTLQSKRIEGYKSV